MSATQAFESLLDFAATGREYAEGEVWAPAPESDDDPRMSRVIGNGHDFQSTISVMDIADGTVDGTVHFRVLRITDGEEPLLFLRTRLEWTTSLGIGHTSSAWYKLSRSDANRLEASDTKAPTVAEMNAMEQEIEERFGKPEEMTIQQAGELFSMALGEMFKSEHYPSGWNQSWSNQMPDEFGDGDPNTDVVTDRAEGEYHGRAVLNLFERDEKLICMLSDSEFGAVYSEELVTLAGWINDNA